MKVSNPLLRAALAAVVLLVLATTQSSLAAGLSEQVAIQTWTLRNLSFDQVVEFAQRHGIKDLQLIPNHLDYKKETQEQIAAKKARLEAAGKREANYRCRSSSRVRGRVRTSRT